MDPAAKALGSATRGEPQPTSTLARQSSLLLSQRSSSGKEFANSSIEASKIAGYSNTRITEECPIVS
jgi:hypothetical protein